MLRKKNVDNIFCTSVGISRRSIVSPNVTELSAGLVNRSSSVEGSRRSGAVFIIIIFIQTISP